MTSPERQKSATEAGMSFRISSLRFCVQRAITKTTDRGTAGVKDQVSVRIAGQLVRGLTDSRTFKASMSRRVNEIEFPTSVRPSPRPGDKG